MASKKQAAMSLWKQASSSSSWHASPPAYALRGARTSSHARRNRWVERQGQGRMDSSRAAASHWQRNAWGGAMQRGSLSPWRSAPPPTHQGVFRHCVALARISSSSSSSSLWPTTTILDSSRFCETPLLGPGSRMPPGCAATARRLHGGTRRGEEEGGGGRARYAMTAEQKQMNTRIMAAKSMTELSGIVIRHSEMFNGYNVLRSLEQLGVLRANSRKYPQGNVSDEEWADEFDLVAKAVGILDKLAVGVAPQMTPANICGVVQSIWRLESSLSLELSDALMEQAIKSIKGFEPRHVSNLPFLMSQLGVRPRLDLLEALVLQADAKVESFKAIDASRFLTALANLQHVPDQGFVDRFLSVFERQLAHLKASEVGFVYWSLGSLGICPPQGFAEELSNCAVAQCNSLNSYNICSIIRAHAQWRQISSNQAQSRVVEMGPVLQERVFERARDTIESFAAREISQFLHAAATLQLSLPDKLSAQLVSRCSRVVQDLDKQGVSNTLWSFGKLNIVLDDRVLDGLVQQVLAVIDEMNTQEVVLVAWALGYMKFLPDRELYTALASRISDVLPNMSEQAIATTLWAISRMGVPTRDAHDLIDSLAHRAVVSLPSIPSPILAHILWSLARLRHADPRYTQPLLHQLLTKDALDSMSGSELVRTLVAVARLLIYVEDQVAVVLLSCIESRAGELTPLEIGSVLRSLAQMRIGPGYPLWEQAVKQVTLRHEEFERHSIGLVVNAHRLMNAPPDDELSSVLDWVYERLGSSDDMRHHK